MHDDDSWDKRGRPMHRQGPTTGIELVMVLVFLCVFIGAAIIMAWMAAGMGTSGVLPLVPLGMAAVAVLMMVVTVVKFFKRRERQALLEAAWEEQRRLESLDRRAREAEMQERLRRSAQSAQVAERIACEYCGVTRSGEEQICGGCGSRRK